MTEFFKIINLNFKIFVNSIKFSNKIEKLRGIFLTFIGIFFFIGCYILSYQAVIYISNLPIIGSLFIIRILALTFLTSFLMFIFSSLIVTLSTMYEAKDMDFLISLPLKFQNIFLIKFLLTSIRSSWMVLLLLLPFCFAFAFVKKFSFYKYPILTFSIIIKILIAVSLGSLLSIFLSYLFPAKKVKNYVLVITILLTAIGYSLFRLAQPENLLSFEKFPELVEYLDFLSKPVGKNLPSWWLSEIFRGLMVGNVYVVILNFSKLLFVCFFVFAVFYFLGKKMYFKSMFCIFSNYEREKNFYKKSLKYKSWFNEIIKKEIKLFFREPVQWVQLIIVISLIIIYIFNISKLPNEFKYVRITVAFFNLGSIMFVLSAFVLRFVFVQPSLEYKNFWLLKSLPIEFKKIFLIKLFIYLPVVLIPAIIMCIVSNIILNVEREIFIMSLLVVLISSFVLTVAGYSFGILFPKKEYQDIPQIETSFGGLIFIILSLCYIVLSLSSLANITKKYILSQHILKEELILSILLFLSINFIYGFSPFYYALKKFLKEY
jgi:ABC-2 type transport system permease protein